MARTDQRLHSVTVRQVGYPTVVDIELDGVVLYGCTGFKIEAQVGQMTKATFELLVGDLDLHCDGVMLAADES